MDARDADIDKDLAATLHARRELGDEYDAALVGSFLEKVERRLDGSVDRRVRRQLAEHQMVAARTGSSPSAPMSGWGERFGFGLLSLILAIPLSAIAVANAGLAGLIVSWLGIVGVNTVHALHTRTTPLRERKKDGDWED